MKYILQILLILIFIHTTLFSFCQSEDNILKIAETQTVRIIATSFNKQHEGFKEFGKGMVLHGKYLATCYHLVSPEDTSYKLATVYLIYNERPENGIILYDSILLKKNFKAKKTQYDFSKHIFIPHDYSTDFIVLKLSKKIKPLNYNNIATMPSKFLDTTYALGNVQNGNIMNQVLQGGIFLFNYTQNLQPTFLSCITGHTKGFSGSPLYNSRGEILGIVQYSIESFQEQFLVNLYRSGVITEKIFNIIQNEYNYGSKLQFAIDFGYIQNKYLKGYW